jgi:hypothetical protein
VGALTIGSTGRAVGFLQSRLGETVDGVFGPATQSALKTAQAARGLQDDGVYGPVTNSAMTGRTASSIATIAERIGVDTAAFGAVMQVETAGAGFFSDGRPVILLERLYVYRQASPEQRRMLTADVCAPQPGGYLGGLNEWARFERVASVLGVDDAAQCVSWGLGQIMGANWRACGATSVADFRARMVQDEDGQLALMAGFIGANAGMLQALKSLDWASFAYRYNGPEYARNAYDTKLAAAYSRLKA